MAERAETVRNELTLKDVVDQAVETGTFDELRASGSWDEYRLRCEAAGRIPVRKDVFRLWERCVIAWK